VAKGNVSDINGPTDLKGRMVGAISGGMDGEITAKAIEKEHGAFKSFKGYAGYAEMWLAHERSPTFWTAVASRRRTRGCNRLTLCGGSARPQIGQPISE